MSLLEPPPSPTTEIHIREFQPGDEAAFRKLNEEWITRYFRVEAKDEAAFSDPQGTILAPGGRIFLAVGGHRHLGCCALLRIGDGQFEVAEMAVTTAARELVSDEAVHRRDRSGTKCWCSKALFRNEPSAQACYSAL